MRYPDIEVEGSITDRLVDLIAEHADVTIRAGHISDMGVTARKIVDFERTICAAPAYLKQHGVPRMQADLANHVCILIAAQTSNRWPFRTRDGIQDIAIGACDASDNADVALGLAIEGGGIVRLADIIVGEPIRRGLLVPFVDGSTSC